MGWLSNLVIRGGTSLVRGGFRPWSVPTLVGLIAFLFGAGCDTGDEAPPPVKMATTTSTANSGLLDYLLPEFTKDTGIRVDYVPTGTGMALAHGRNGDVDVVLAHAPAAEDAFVEEGYGVERVPVMWNDFVIAGPGADPAKLTAAGSAAQAFQRIAGQQAIFISRGDDSGTHKKELALWEGAGVEPAGAWYVEAGQGMGACLTMAHEKEAYILTDRGTYLAFAGKVALEVLYEGDPQLRNPYAIIAVSPEKYPDRNHEGARKLIEWMTSTRAQQLIADFKVGGEQLFYLFEGSERSEWSG